MSDLLWGVIIGAAIGFVGSWIQAHYALKARREENLSREQQQATQIQHEKDSQLISRRIAVRSRYLEPLSNHLCDLYIQVTECAHDLMIFIRPYCAKEETDEVKVPKDNRQEFKEQMQKIRRMCLDISGLNDKVFRAAGQIGDRILIEKLTTVTQEVTTVLKAGTEMSASLLSTPTETDFVYDFEPLWKSLRNAGISISNTHGRIESLLSGVDAED